MYVVYLRIVNVRMFYVRIYITYARTYICNTKIHTYTHTYTHVYTHMYEHSHIHTYIHTYKCTFGQFPFEHALRAVLEPLLVEEEVSHARSVAEALEDGVHEALAGRGGEGRGGEGRGGEEAEANH